MTSPDNKYAKPVLASPIPRRNSDLVCWSERFQGQTGKTHSGPDSTPVERRNEANVLAQLDKATSDHRVTIDEWCNDILPIAAWLPLKDSPASRKILDTWASVGGDNLTRDEAAARASMRHFLELRGYPAPPIPPTVSLSPGEVNRLIASNPTAPDLDFETVLKAAGVTPSQPEIIAVLDSEFLAGPAYFDDQLWSDPSSHGEVHGWDFVDHDADLRESDPTRSHGSSVAGVAARGTKLVQIMPLRVQDSRESSDSMLPDRLVEAIDFAVSNGARIINISLWVLWDEEGISKIRNAMNRHAANGTVFVLGAGNDGQRLDESRHKQEHHLQKTELPNVAVVAAANSEGKPWMGENAGTSFGDRWVRLAARGEGVTTAGSGSDENSYFVTEKGTSIAAPNLGAVMARCRLLDEGLSASQLIQILDATSDLQSEWESKVSAGGPINEARAIRLAAITGMVRRGKSPEQAFAQLGIDSAQGDRLMQLARLVSANAD